MFFITTFEVFRIRLAAMTAFTIDVFEFCWFAERRDGEADLSRLAAECGATNESLRWATQGGTNGFGHPELTMAVAGKLGLICQRCMTGLEHEIASGQVLMLAKSDEQANEIETLLDDESIDRIVGIEIDEHPGSGGKRGTAVVAAGA